MGRLIFFDTETTGTHVDKDRIIELAAYDSLSEQSFSTLINPQIPIPEEASKIHGIYDKDVKDAPDFVTAFQLFSDFCKEDGILVAHNNDHFDTPILKKECLRHHLTPLSLKTIDSLKWAQKYRPDLPKHNLQYLRYVYGIEENQAHRALDDVMTLYRVFAILIGDLSPDQVYDLMYNINPSIMRMPFGKHKGQLLKDVPASYIRWLEEQGALDKEENKILKQAIELLRQQTTA